MVKRALYEEEGIGDLLHRGVENLSLCVDWGPFEWAWGTFIYMGMGLLLYGEMNKRVMPLGKVSLLEYPGHGYHAN